jgi:hypothetical protein
MANWELIGVPVAVAMVKKPNWASPYIVFSYGSVKEVTQRREELGESRGGQGVAVEARWPASQCGAAAAACSATVTPKNSKL